MRKMSTKTSCVVSFVSLLLCVSMLIGTTFAWFTDSVSSGISRIIAGNLDVEMYWAEHFDGPWYNAEDPEHAILFGEDELWEPGYTSVRYIKIINAGSLALKYRLGVEAAGEVGALADVIDVKYIPEGMAAGLETRSDFSALPTFGNLRSVLAGFTNSSENAPTGMILPAGEISGGDAFVGETICALALHMQEEAGNEYKKANVGAGFYVTVTATQIEYESDSFNPYYDEDVAFPALNLPKSISAAVELDENHAVKEETSLQGEGDVSAVVPVGTKLEDGTTQAVLTVTKVSSDGNISASDTVISQTLDVHMDGVAADNDKPILVTVQHAFPANMNSGAIALYHKEDGVQNLMTGKPSADAVTEHNDYYYNSTTGDVIMALAHFSEILLKMDASNPWDGKATTDWYKDSETIFSLSTAEQLAGLASLVNEGNDLEGKTIVLDKSIVLNNWTKWGTTAEQLHSNNSPVYYPSNGANAQPNGGTNGDKPYYFTPIGTDDHPFKGTFDGDGHFISGLFRIHYGENDGYDDAYIGVFGCVDGATVKNLTVKDGFVESFGGLVGVVAATAKGNCTFDNIKIRNNYILTYNEYLGGVVGYYGDGTGTFKDISVDNTNNFGALWGTYDLPCGGIIGGIGSSTNINLTDCVIFPSMDLYNDCCANYQWFNYRYSGMLVGYLPGSDIVSFAQSHIICKNVSVYYGDWTSEYYCELRSLGKGSYNGETEWKYTKISRNAGAAGSCGHDHAANNAETTTWRGVAYGPNEAHEDHCCVNIAFHQLFGGGQGVKGVETHDGVNTVEKDGSISVKFPNTDKYLYRVGNMNAVALGSLFEKAQNTPSIDANAVDITAEQIAGVTSVEYAKNSTDWEKSTLKFSGTGVTKLVLKYADNAPVELVLEVVEAMNATTATSATANNVVLLNDVSGSSIDVSNGYTFYGNGFKLSFSGNGSRNAAAGYAEGFVNITNGGILDNTQVVCKVFPKAYLYKTSGTEYITESSNVVSSTDTTHYKYQWSAVAISGNGSTISNSYVYGARNNVYIGNGNVSLDNCVLECGALANLQIISNEQSTVSFKNLTTVQYLATDEFGVGNKMLGGAILIGSGDKDAMATEQNPSIVVSGGFKQYNWVSSADKDEITGSTQKTIINLALGQSAYSHNGYVNMGIVCLNGNDLSINGLPEGYSIQTVSNLGSSGQVYSLDSAHGTVNTAYNSNNKYPYQPSTQGMALPSINYETSDERLTVSKTPTSMSIIAKLDARDQFDFKFSDMSLSYGGNDLNYTVMDSSNEAVDKSQTVSLSDSGDTVYTLTASADAGYNPDGTVKSETRNVSIKLTISISLKATPAPEWISEPSGTPIYVGDSKGGDWSIAVPVLDGAKIQYWSTESNSLKELDLSTISGVTKTTNNNLTITGSDYTLELTSGAIKSGKTNMWVMAGGKLYVTVSSTSDYVSTGTSSRSTTVTYKFTANSKADAPKSTSKSFSANKPSSDDTTYKYSDLTSGKLTELTSGSGCFASGTLITLADGSQMPIEEVKLGDVVKTWNFETGTYENMPVTYIWDYGTDNYKVINLEFSDNIKIQLISQHELFATDTNEFVEITEENYKQFKGRTFAYRDGDCWRSVELLNAYTDVETTGMYSLMTACDINSVANGLLNQPTTDIPNFFKYFDISEDMKYDEEKMQNDINTYGLADYKDWEFLGSYKTFVAFNGKYFDILTGKGIATKQDIINYAMEYTKP